MEFAIGVATTSGVQNGYQNQLTSRDKDNVVQSEGFSFSNKLISKRFPTV